MRSDAEPTTQKRPAWLAVTPAVFVVLWATGFIGARMIGQDAEPLSFLAVRFVIAAGLLALVALATGAPWPDRRGALHAVTAGALVHGGYLGPIFWTISNGMPAGVSALIVGLQPLLTAFIAGLLLSERITARHVLGLLTGIAGVAMVVWPKLSFSGTGITPLGVGLTVAGTLSITLGSIYQKRFAAGHDLRSANVYQFLGAALVVAAGAVALERFDITWTGSVIFAMVWLVLVLSIGAVSLLYILIRHGEVSKVAGLFYLVPAVTAVIAWLLFGETLLPAQMGGMAVCAAAVMLVMKRG
jgi:drug/metabolite transporter (DMT)-like permease